MKLSRVRNIFTKLKVQDLCIPGEAEVLRAGLFSSDEPVNKKLDFLFNSPILSKSKVFEITGTHSVLVLAEDLDRILKYLVKNPAVLNEEQPFWIESFGYKILMIDDLESYDPAAGYLYNQLNKDKKSNFIIYRTLQRPIGVTNYDLAVSSVNKKLSVFF